MQKHVIGGLNRQYDRMLKYSRNKDLNELKLTIKSTRSKYFSQRDNYTQPHRTCNSSSNAIYLDWIMRVCGFNGLSNDDGYIREVFKRGDTIYHWVQTSTIKHFGFSTKWMTDYDYQFILGLIDAGFVVPVNILHRGTTNNPTGGHVIALVGMRNGHFIAHDPYGTLESNYRNTNGKHSLIKQSEFKRRWQGGYRILA